MNDQPKTKLEAFIEFSSALTAAVVLADSLEATVKAAEGSISADAREVTLWAERTRLLYDRMRAYVATLPHAHTWRA